MRKAILYLLVTAVVVFYAGVAGAAASPYYGAVTTFLHEAIAAPPAAASPTPANGQTRTAQATAVSARVTPGATTSALGPFSNTNTLKARPTALPQQRLAEAVQHMASTSKVPSRRFNILILGSDNDAKFTPGAVPPTQVMIVASIDTVSHTITLLSIPRDFYVHIPGYQYNASPDGTTVGYNKIDVATGLGLNSAICTVESNFGIPIDHWVWVGLKGFIKVIDTMNGVTVDVAHPVLDDTYPDDLAGSNNPYAFRRLYIPPGPQHLNGDTALHFVRSRHGDILGDFGRSARQQIVLTQLRRELTRQDGASLVALVPSLLKDFQGELQTDISPDLRTASFYLALMRSVAHATITQVVLKPPVYSTDYWFTDHDPGILAINGGQPLQEDGVLPNWQAINPEIQSLFGGQYFTNPHCNGGTGTASGQ